MTDDTLADARHALLVVAEVLLALATAAMVLWFPLYQSFTYTCFFGDCTPVTADEIDEYWWGAAVFAGLCVATMGVAWCRGARAAYGWHVLVALAGAASIVVFQVPAVDWAEHFREDPPPADPSYVPCYSGSNDCGGGG